MMRARALLTLGLALVLAGTSVVLARAWLDDAARAPVSTPARAVQDQASTQLVVAARALPYGTRVRPADVKLVGWPSAAVPPGALHDLEWLAGEPGALEGPSPRVLRPIAPNEPVLRGKISGFGAPARLAATIAPGMRATAIHMSGTADIVTLVGPGDRVDILIARQVARDGGERELRSDVLLRDVRVLGLDESAGGPGASATRVRAVTLEVTVEQAQILAVAEKIGTLSLALRGLDTRDAAASTPVSSRDLPAGLLREGIQPAAWRVAKKAVPDLVRNPADTGSTPPAASVRVFRGVEAFEYEVQRERLNGAIPLIDAAKASTGRAGAVP